ncbi:PREDICTED: death-associated protein kinase 2-like [Acropora digitifera]|uniref:death-associated protein kinase 2-like n=1 Tax=Acropora digitifera TaxID=70779 RepID=UPI00077A563F|nr:PREDICTED: death-associated protein kinase 2-like [Acropora digitifera]
MTDSLMIRKDNFENFYDILDEIGSGQFAVVKKCSEKSTGTEYAAKIMKKKRRRGSRRGVSTEEIIREASILLKTRHEGVIYLHAVFETTVDYTLVLELVSGGELFEFLSEQEYLSESEALGFTKQVVEAIHYLHDNHIVHLDIKPENIVLKDREEKKIKLIDFGLAKIIPPGEIVRAIMGTPEFVAPEVLNFEPVGTQTDMWAVGVLTYILLSGASPFLADDDNETFMNIQNVDYKFDEEYFSEISKQAKDFISKLLLKNPRDRLSARDCLKHSWLQPDEEAVKKRRSTLIKTDTFKAFTARERWKTSMKKVIALNRLGVLGKKEGSNGFESESSDTSDSESEIPHETNDRKKPLENSKLLQDSTYSK